MPRPADFLLGGPYPVSRPLTHRDVLEGAILAHLSVTPERCAFYETLPWSLPARALFDLIAEDPSTVGAVGFAVPAALDYWAFGHREAIQRLAVWVDDLTVRELLAAGALADLATQLLQWDDHGRRRAEAA